MDNSLLAEHCDDGNLSMISANNHCRTDELLDNSLELHNAYDRTISQVQKSQKEIEIKMGNLLNTPTLYDSALKHGYSPAPRSKNYEFKSSALAVGPLSSYKDLKQPKNNYFTQVAQSSEYDYFEQRMKKLETRISQRVVQKEREDSPGETKVQLSGFYQQDTHDDDHQSDLDRSRRIQVITNKYLAKTSPQRLVSPKKTFSKVLSPKRGIVSPKSCLPPHKSSKKLSSLEQQNQKMEKSIIRLQKSNAILQKKQHLLQGEQEKSKELLLSQEMQQQQSYLSKAQSMLAQISKRQFKDIKTQEKKDLLDTISIVKTKLKQNIERSEQRNQVHSRKRSRQLKSSNYLTMGIATSKM